MSKKFLLVLMFLAAIVIAGFAFAASEEKGAGSILYVCNCGADCKCNTVSVKPGKCSCGTELAPTHVLKLENENAIVCTCGKDCTCKIDPKDPTKCGCGKPVKKVSIKGMYACACGGGCSCNIVSDEPGKCKCGKDLKKV